MRAAVLVTWLILMAFFVLSLPALPAQVGSAGSELPKLAYLAVMMGSCSLIVLMDSVLPWLLRHAPKLVNLPHRDFWLAQPRLEATLVRVRDGLAGIELQVLALLGGLHLCTLIKTHNAALPEEIMLIPALLVVPFLIVSTLRLQRSFALPKA